MPLLHRDLSEKILEAFYQVHYELGSGFPESVYASAMEIALTDLGVRVQREVPVRVYFRGRLVGWFRADSVAESKIILEYKSTLQATEAGEAQLLNYLRCSQLEVGLLLCFSAKATFKRLLLSNDRKQHKVPWVRRDRQTQ
ncbi:MAG TPA: GxxExxY protein [Gemmatimonadaceae bacterium]|nr:GxxExxY protein [Gemmatimonadaceae bacterium]